MVAPLNNPYGNTGNDQGPMVDPNLNPSRLPDGSAPTQPMTAEDLAASLNSTLASQAQFQQQTSSQMQALSEQQNQSLQTFTTLAESIQQGQQAQQAQQLQQQQLAQQQAQQIAPPEMTPEEQQYMQENPHAASIVTKQAQYLAQQAAQNMSNENRRLLQENQTALDTRLNQMQAENQQLRTQTVDSFNNDMNNYASSLQLNLSEAESDPKWQTYMARPVSPLSTQTVREALQGAAKGMNQGLVQEGIRAFVAEFYPQNIAGAAALNQPQQYQQPGQPQQYQQPGQPPQWPPAGQPPAEMPPGYPGQMPSQMQPQMPPPGQPQMQYGPNGQMMPSQMMQQQPAAQMQGMPPATANRGNPAPPRDVSTELNQIVAKQNDLRLQRDRQSISGEDFDTQLATLTQDMYRLQQEQHTQQQNQQPYY